MSNNATVNCPKCKEVFKVDDSVFSNIVKQVRDQQFNDELSSRLEIAENDKKSAVAFAQEKLKNDYQKQLAQKQGELDLLTQKSKSDLIQEVSKKDDAIKSLEARLDKIDTQKQLELSNAVREIEKAKDQLENDLKSKDLEKELLEKSLTEKFNDKLNHKDETLKLKEDEILRLKDFKQKLSTKMIGETLELHCETEFNKLRSTAFQNAYFGKDNNDSEGTKGDYVFKEKDINGNEIVSIMFEMKNEVDETKAKMQNKKFFSKLDKDRRDKGCEYAVLVSMLESDNELYNTGIVDVSHEYKKMYVIRPQFFIPIISLLRNAGMNSLQYKADLAIMRNQNIDVTNFEEKLNIFREGFNKNYMNAASQFDTAMIEIDKSIDHLTKIKEALRLTSKHLSSANNKADGLTIKKLTHGNPTMKEKFNNTSNQ
tara:strand:+ start:151 stop:1431 length:1281 start_codon:yes stop_codon:yes gene_type:complete